MINKPKLQGDLSVSALPRSLSFDEGLKKARDIIGQLLEKQDVLTVAINGAGPMVGKTYLSGQIAQGLIEQAVPTGVCTYPDDIELALSQIIDHKELLDNQREEVYIFNGWEVPHGIRRYGHIDLRSSYDDRLKSVASSLALPIGKVDLWLALYSKQTPFVAPPAWADEPYDPFEDVIIFNEKAKIR